MSTLNARSWSLAEKFALRFFVVLFLLYTFPFPLDYLPFIPNWYTEAWQAVIPWIAAHILHLPAPITIFTNGSGDTTYDYVLLLTQFSIAFLAALVWSFLDRKRSSYDTLHYWLRVLVRYYLAAGLFIYGFIKVFHLQMPFPYLSQLVQPFGEKSPMGLAWSYMGYSKGYSAFTGWSEVIAGLFLLFRRTTTLGAVFSVAVTVNIVAVNLCFDVPVKLFSSMLLLMSLFLLMPDMKRLLNLLVLNRPVDARVYRSYLHRRWLRITAVVVKYAAIVIFLYNSLSSDIKSVKEYGDQRPLPPLYGIYNADLVVRNGDTLAPLTTDSTRWRQLIIQFPKRAMVKMMNDSIKQYAFSVDTLSKKATIYKQSDTTQKYTLAYMADAGKLVLTGKLWQDSVYFQFSKRDINSFLLVNRGFHWINEHPFNR